MEDLRSCSFVLLTELFWELNKSPIQANLYRSNNYFSFDLAVLERNRPDTWKL